MAHVSVKHHGVVYVNEFHVDVGPTHDILYFDARTENVYIIMKSGMCISGVKCNVCLLRITMVIALRRYINNVTCARCNICVCHPDRPSVGLCRPV